MSARQQQQQRVNDLCGPGYCRTEHDNVFAEYETQNATDYRSYKYHDIGCASSQAKIPSQNSSDRRTKRNSSQKCDEEIQEIEYGRTDQSPDHASQEVNG